MGITMRPLIRPGHHRILRRTRRPSRDRCFVAPSSHGHDLHLLTRNAAEDYTLLFPEPVPALAHFPAPRVPVVPLSKPSLQSARRLANRALFHGRHKIQNVVLRLASETVKDILAEAGPKGIVTLSAVDRTAAFQLIPAPAQARALDNGAAPPPG